MKMLLVEVILLMLSVSAVLVSTAAAVSS